MSEIKSESRPQDALKKTADAFRLIRTFFPEYKLKSDWSIIREWIHDNLHATSVIVVLESIQLDESQINELLSLGKQFSGYKDMVPLLLNRLRYSEVLLKKLVEEYHVEEGYLLDWILSRNNGKEASIGAHCFEQYESNSNEKWLSMARKLGCTKNINPLEGFPKNNNGEYVLEICNGQYLWFNEIETSHGSFWISRTVLPKDIFLLHPNFSSHYVDGKQNRQTCKELLDILSKKFDLKFQFPSKVQWVKSLRKGKLLKNYNQKEWLSVGVVVPMMDNKYNTETFPDGGLAALRPVITMEEDVV
ncbi:MAG: hypothetical protein HUK23_03855 [Sphaerochaetaceae bacterium]|nr:hypothetical protein [Sphaerochaetaceae bacterium]